MKEDKKEKVYWGVKESEIDETLLRKIDKYQQICLVATATFLPVVILNLILNLLSNYFDKTAHLILSGIVIVIMSAVLVLYVIYLVNIVKLKNQVQKTQNTQKNSEK